MFGMPEDNAAAAFSESVLSIPIGQPSEKKYNLKRAWASFREEVQTPL